MSELSLKVSRYFLKIDGGLTDLGNASDVPNIQSERGGVVRDHDIFYYQSINILCPPPQFFLLT